jgi:hypothetical protein
VVLELLVKLAVAVVLAALGYQVLFLVRQLFTLAVAVVVLL